MSRPPTHRRLTLLLLALLLLAGLLLVGDVPPRAGAQSAPGRFNAGGPLFVDGAGQTWLADTGSTDGATYSVANAIAGTTDDTLYQSERYFVAPGTYAYAVANGSYTVTLKFAELFSDNVGDRVFSVALEGVTVLSTYDILSEVPKFTAVDKTFTTTVSDGSLTILFTGVVGAAKVNAIEITAGGGLTPTPTPTPGPPVGTAAWRIGVYDAWGSSGASTTTLNAMIADTRAHHLDGIVYSNGDNNAGVTQSSALSTTTDPANYWVTISPWSITGTAGNGYWAIVNPTTADAAGYAQTIVTTFQGRSSVKGYNLLDDARDSYATHIRLLVHELRRLDPSRFAAVAGVVDQQDVYYQLAQAGDLTGNAYLGWAYPVGASSPACMLNYGGYQTAAANTFDQALRQMTKWVPSGVPRYFGIQEHGTGTYDPLAAGGTLRRPLVEELREQQWLAMAERLDGVFWFLYADDGAPGNVGLTNATNADLYAEVADLAARARTIEQEYTATQKATRQQFTVSPTTGGLNILNQPTVQTLYNPLTQAYYVLAVNRSCSTETLTIASAGGFTGGQLLNLETGVSTNLGQGISFRGGDGALYKLTNAAGNALLPVAATNLLTNGSFDTNQGGFPASWSPATGGSRTTTTVHAGSGTGALQMAGGASGTNGTSQQTFLLQPNTRYTVQFWVRTNAITSPGVSVRYATTAPTLDMRGSRQYNGTQDWTLVTDWFYTPAALTSGTFQILWELNAGGTAWLDDLRLCAGDTCGLVGPTATPTPVLSPTPTPTATATATPTLTPTRTNTPAAGTPSNTPVNTPTATRTATTTATATRTPSPTVGVPTPTATAAPGAVNAVPALVPNYTQDVETWWSTHRYNPEYAGYLPVGAVNHPAPLRSMADYGDNLQAAVDSLPPAGGTIYFPNGTWTGQLRMAGRSHVHFIGESENGVIIQPVTRMREILILGCEGVRDEPPNLFTNFNASLKQQSLNPALDQWATTCITSGRATDIYFGNMTFAGNVSPESVALSAVKDVLFENVTWKDHGTNPADGTQASGDPVIVHHPHPGGLSSNQGSANVFLRRNRFMGETRALGGDRVAVYNVEYIDGCHGCGITESIIDANFEQAGAGGAGGTLFMANDDVTSDYNHNGVLDADEQKIAKYIAVVNNQFGPAGSLAYLERSFQVVGQHALFKKNQFLGGKVTETTDGAMVYWEGKCDNNNLRSDYGNSVDVTMTDMVVDGNQLPSGYPVWYWNTTGGGAGVPGVGSECNLVNNAFYMYGFTIKNNQIGASAGSLVTLYEPQGTVGPPRITSNNCFAGNLWEGGAACTMAATATAYPTPAAAVTSTPSPTVGPTVTPSSAPRTASAVLPQPPLVTTAQPLSYTVDLLGAVTSPTFVRYTFAFVTDLLDSGECIEVTGGFSPLGSGAQARGGFCNRGVSAVSSATITLRCARVPTACTAYADGQDAGQLRVRRPNGAAGSVRVQSLTVTVSP